MKSEGRQRGMVRKYPILSTPMNRRPKPNIVNGPTAGPSTKVLTEPTNNSEFAGKSDRPMFSECHTNPSCKFKYKVKGAQDVRPSLKLSGVSASSLLNDLLEEEYEDSDNRVDYDGDSDNH